MLSNEELIRYLKEKKWLSSPAVEAAFKAVDRKLFLPPSLSTPAYFDQPLQLGPIHISAPFIYALALEALELRPGQSFLNVGSGTGYMSALAHQLVTNKGANHAIELQAEALELSINNIQRLEERMNQEIGIVFVCGNGLVLSSISEGHHNQYDRVFVGAGCMPDEETLGSFVSLLSCPGGVLVAPFEKRLLKIVRSSTEELQIEDLALVDFVPLQYPRQIDYDKPPVLPPKSWSPEHHHNFPQAFKDLVLQVLMISLRQKNIVIGAWFEVLSYLFCDGSFCLGRCAGVNHLKQFNSPDNCLGFVRSTSQRNKQTSQCLKIGCIAM